MHKLCKSRSRGCVEVIASETFMVNEKMKFDYRDDDLTVNQWYQNVS